MDVLSQLMRLGVKRRLRIKFVNKGRSDVQSHETIGGNYGRVEARHYWTVSDIDCIDSKDAWRDLQTIGMVENERYVGDKVTAETRYYISSLRPVTRNFSRSLWR